MFASRLPVMPLQPRRLASAVAALSAVLLAACGDGSRVKEFDPDQVIAFGDEYSAFAPDEVAFSGGRTLNGFRYTINYVPLVGATYCNGAVTTRCASSFTDFTEFTSGTIDYERSDPADAAGDQRTVTERDTGTAKVSGATTASDFTVFSDWGYVCSPKAGSSAGIWVQTLASAFGSSRSFGSGYCSQDVGNAKSYAEWGATAASTVSQIAAHRGEFKEGTLVTVFAGQNDIVAKYQEVKGGLPQATAQTQLAAAGKQLADAVNDTIQTGAKVLVVMVPNLGLAPIANGNTSDADLMKGLVQAYNEGVRLNLTNNGRSIGLVDGYRQFTTSSATNTTDKGCDVTKITKKPNGDAITSTGAELERERLLYCTSRTVTGNNALTYYLWADSTHLGPIGHATLATLAYDRIRNNF